MLWKGALTGSSTARLAPAAFRASIALFTGSTAPAITTWPGQLKFTACTAAPISASTALQISTILSLSKPKTAAMEPCPTGTASCMNWPRLCTATTASANFIAPTLTRAEYSPRLWPAATAQLIPCSFSTAPQAVLAVRMAGWVLAVSCRSEAGPSKHILLME